jgi:pullulanase
MGNDHQRAFDAYLDEMDTITILLPKHQDCASTPVFTLIESSGDFKRLEIILFEEHEAFYKYQCRAEVPVEIGKSVYVSIDGIQSDLQIGAVVRTPAFDEQYAYFGDDLGATYCSSATLFKVWAPTAVKVRVKLQHPNKATVNITDMHQKTNGIWALNIEGDFDGYLYTFIVCVNKVWREAVDPYAKSVSMNGRHGVVINHQKIQNSPVPLPKLAQFTDAIIYETHIRDFTIHQDSGVSFKGKYKGFTESTSETGIDYLSDLGITHIELLPVNDFEGVKEENPKESYNWGYNPIHFFAPEGSYSTNPRDPYNRLLEFQHMIQEIHLKGMKVIIDVVFNHVYIKEESSFEKIVPGYYFRYDQNGLPSNGTGVGNDIATERRMVRKLIVDCVLYWIHVFQVDGFRFDLMGIIDVETMNEIRKQVDQVNDSILLLGEGWELNTPLPKECKATIRNADKLPRIAHFNDRFRDLVKGSTFNLYDRGYSLGSSNQLKEVKQVIAGSASMFKDPSNSINYVESHDNHTFWDKALESNSYENEEILRRRQRLATSMVILSQGVPFIHSGQEFYRTKLGIGNSYKSPDEVNQLDWSRKSQCKKDVLFIKELIAVRKSHGAFRFPSSRLIRKHMSFLSTTDEVIAFELQSVLEFGQWDYVLVIFNNSVQEQQVNLSEKHGWLVLADHQQASSNGMYRLVTKKLIIHPISCLVLVR